MEAPGKYPPASDDTKPGDDFTMEDLLDFTHGDEESAVADITLAGSMITAVESSNSGDPVVSSNLAGNQSAGELCVPYDDLAELEWLSNFVEESFSSEDLQKLQLVPETRESEFRKTDPTIRPDPSVPGKARSKRSRAATCNWSSSVFVISPDASGEYSSKASRGEKGSADHGRRCTHCATEKTPQWRTGPMGPKTLCNACGVRYKSGRLVPEYRPAASPTFVLTKHSNSHRKVLELRRQKELLMAHQQQQDHEKLFNDAMLFDALASDDYFIDQPQFTRLI